MEVPELLKRVRTLTVAAPEVTGFRLWKCKHLKGRHLYSGSVH